MTSRCFGRCAARSGGSTTTRRERCSPATNVALGANWTLHDLRHTAAYRMAQDPEMPLVDVQWVLGHAHLQTTQTYLRPSADDVVAAVRAHHARRGENAPAPGPSEYRGNPACANVARTDTHIQRLRTEIENLTEEATSPLTPTPLRERLSQRITALQRIADRHEQTKIVPAHPERPQ